jgi:NADH:ubiquinone oxidoreductase subunit 3 (subunit A)
MEAAFSIHFLCAIKWKNWSRQKEVFQQKWLLIGIFFLLFSILFSLLFPLCWQEAYENVIFMCSENIKFSSKKKEEHKKKL